MTRSRCAGIVALTAFVAACSAAPSTHSSATPRPSLATSAGSASSAAALAACPSAVQMSSLPVVARVSGDPDDVTVTADGTVWVSDRDGNRILRLSAQGAVQRTFADPYGPEGIVVLSDGTVIVAQQVPDRLDVLHVDSGLFTPWLQLGATSPTNGVDGIGLDGTAVLVPDSAHGRLLSVMVGPGDAASTNSVIATGLGRPVAAVRAPAGGYLVALENQPGLALVQPGATGPTPVVHVDSLDDLVVRGGLVYASDLTDRSVLAIDPGSGAMRTLVGGAPSPQGLALLPGGDLLVVDPTAQTLVSVPAC